MLNLYQTNTLTVTEIREYSIYVDGGTYGPISLRETHDGLQIGDNVEAYVYLDAEDEIVATMARASANVGECAYLQVISDGPQGTYLDWGLPKDLLLPFSEQTQNLTEGRSYVVYIFQDDRQRPVASMKLHRYLDEEQNDLTVGEAVNLLIASESDLGFKAVINNEQIGLIYHDELARPLQIGTEMKGWVKKIRSDGKINLNINRMDNETRDQLDQEILDQLEQQGGRLDLSDKSAPDLIYASFKVSKKNFKRAISRLYKQRIITVSDTYIELSQES